MKFGLSESDWESIEDLLIRPLRREGARVWIFGSRARGNHQVFSDIDILFELPADFQPQPGWLYEIESSLEESNLPIKVDLVRADQIAESYRTQIDKEKIELF